MFEFLENSVPITSQQWSEDTVPLVSISCITYNHENYIRDAIEGFLMQKTTFPVEILIHDDASTDKTADIIREYENKYPDIIKPIYQFDNKYSKGISVSETYNFPRARGKYIAMCEGDDYWTDPLKLQKQVDFLEANTDCSLCFHASKHIRNNNPENNSIHKPKKLPADNKFEMKHTILGGGGFMATNSMLFYSKYIQDRPMWMENTPVGDLPLMLLLAFKGKIGYIDDVMSVYRIASSPTAWSQTIQEPSIRKSFHYALLEMFNEFDKWSSKRFHSFVVKEKNKLKWDYLKFAITTNIIRFLKENKIFLR